MLATYGPRFSGPDDGSRRYRRVAPIPGLSQGSVLYPQTYAARSRSTEPAAGAYCVHRRLVGTVAIGRGDIPGCARQEGVRYGSADAVRQSLLGQARKRGSEPPVSATAGVSVPLFLAIRKVFCAHRSATFSALSPLDGWKGTSSLSPKSSRLRLPIFRPLTQPCARPHARQRRRERKRSPRSSFPPVCQRVGTSRGV